jgi:alanine-alpha-ketoisovalerate/valine-pyruvate aminotransferase
MEWKLRRKGGRSFYRKRSQSVEAVFGQHVTRGCDRLLMRKEEGAGVVWPLFSEDAQITEAVGAAQGPDSQGVADTIAPLGF